MSSKLTEQRRIELDLLRPWVRKGMQVLEVGGGNGFQAGILSSWGCTVRSIDIVGRTLPEQQYYPVTDYDGCHLPDDDGTYDLIFTSNVLEHVEHLTQLFDEMQRVLKPDGLLVHILPSVSWRVWTSLAHYPFLFKYFFLRKKALPTVNQAPALKKRGIFKTVARVLMAGGHGVNQSALADLYYFRRRHWESTFRNNGFRMIQVVPNGLFYTGYDIFPSIGMTARKSLSHLLGSSCYMYVMAVGSIAANRQNITESNV